MIKSGILTFHYAHNYGAALQAYSLMKTLRENGQQVKFINYRIPKIEDVYCQKSFFKIAKDSIKQDGVLRGIYHFPERYMLSRVENAKRNNFNKFIDEFLDQTDRVETPSEINALGLDCIYCGSDQIWNPSLTGDLIPTYFCEGITSDTTKIAYAGSNGADNVAPEMWDKFKSLITNFDAISIREKGLSIFLENEGIHNTCVLDPIFLCEKKDWEEIAILPDEDDYLLTYSFCESPDFFDYAERMASHLNKKLIILSFTKRRPSKTGKVVYTAGPREFLGYFLKADYIITNSFHGTAFSILLKKPFSCFIPKINKERVYSLINLFGLQKRVIEDPRILHDNYEVDSASIDSIVKLQKEISLSFIKQNGNNRKS